MSLEPNFTMVAYCIECGRDISHDSTSHVLCSTCYTLDKAMKSESRTINFCNICGQQMQPVAGQMLQIAHDYCLHKWVRAAGARNY